MIEKHGKKFASAAELRRFERRKAAAGWSFLEDNVPYRVVRHQDEIVIEKMPAVGGLLETNFADLEERTIAWYVDRAEQAEWYRTVIAEEMGYDGPAGDVVCPLRDWLQESKLHRTAVVTTRYLMGAALLLGLGLGWIAAWILR